LRGGCYLCKRKENEDSLLLQGNEDSEFEMVFRPIEIDAFVMESDEEVEMLFPLCKECQILLGLNSAEEEMDEEV